MYGRQALDKRKRTKAVKCIESKMQTTELQRQITSHLADDFIHFKQHIC